MKITVGVLTVSDRCSSEKAVDESGPALVEMIKRGIIGDGDVVKTALVPDDKDKIQEVIKGWCDEGVQVILTTGGTGVGERDVTPEATMSLIEKEIPGMERLMFKESSKLTPLAALSRSVCGTRKKSLIINFPGSKKASRECLESVAEVIPHALDLIQNKQKKVAEVHSSLQTMKSKVTVKTADGKNRVSSYPCIEVEEAQTMILDRIYTFPKEKTVRYDQALGLVLAQNVVAKDCLPPFAVSLKDGYAVISSDKNYTKDVIGFSRGGHPVPDDLVVGPGQCVRVNTGARIPCGADAVIPVEDTELQLADEDGKEEKMIKVTKLPSPGEEIREKGFDFRTGNLLLSQGTLLDSSALGLLAAAGATSVRVFAAPVVGVFSTGDELVSPEEDVSTGKIRDSNRITLMSLLKENGFSSLDLGIVPDDPDSLCNSLARGFKMADIIVTTGSMSMGDRDYLKEVLLADFDAEILFGRVRMKPGKPTCCALLKFEGKPKMWFGLPGNPASATVTTHLFVLPALRKILGLKKVLPTAVTVVGDFPVNTEERPNYVRATLSLWGPIPGMPWHATVLGNQSSSRIGSCVNANCLVRINAFRRPTKTDTALPSSFIGKNTTSLFGSANHNTTSGFCIANHNTTSKGFGSSSFCKTQEELLNSSNITSQESTKEPRPTYTALIIGKNVL